MHSEKFSLKWNDFQKNVSQSFGLLRQEEDLFDVTLVSDDEMQIPAHRSNKKVPEGEVIVERAA